MKMKRINGHTFEKMIKNGLANLKQHEKKVNDMNVFPVTDGDTGTNMCLTLENGIKYTQSNQNLGEYLKGLSEGMLLGARGNSGVILSQIFRGFYLELARDSIADVSELKDALIRGYQTAYATVTRPVEGTILTVAREGIENIKNQLGRGVYVPNLFSMYLAEMRKVLAQTPEMLAPLKEAGVVDSGGMGYVLIVEGMEKCLYGEEIASASLEVSSTSTAYQRMGNFNSSSSFEVGYCMEFLLQLLNARQAFDVEAYIKALQPFGNSLVCVQNDDIVKVHIHTKIPAKIIEESQKYGEFRSFKLENMQIQCEEMMNSIAVTKEITHKEVAIIAISSGDGIKELFDSFGCDIVIDGGKTMNTSAEEILNALQGVSADKIVLFPNHENIVKAAEQAVKISKLDNVVIMPSKNVMECYYALALDIGDAEDVQERLQTMEDACKAIRTFQITQCVKDCVCNGVVCTKGEYVVLEDGAPIACEKDYFSVIDILVDKQVFETAENCMIFTGATLNNLDLSEYAQVLRKKGDGVEVSFMDGKQRIYDLIIGVV